MKFNGDGLNSNLSVQDIAAIIAEDAADTYSKYSEVFPIFADLYDLQDSVHDDSQYALDTVNHLLDFFESSPELSLVLNDGDIIWLKETNETIDGHACTVINQVVKNGQELINTPILYKDIVDDTVTTVSTNIKDMSGVYLWDIEEILSSVQDSIDASGVFNRLANLAQNANITAADIDAIVSDYVLQPGSDLTNLMSNLKNLGTNLNPSIVIRCIQSTYKTMADTVVTGDTIDWNTNDYSVTSYAGTVIKSALLTAGQVLSQVLMFAGNVVLKVAGALLLGASYVAQSVYTGLQYVAGELGKYNPLADTKEFPMPVWQYVLGHSDDTSFITEYGSVFGPVFEGYVIKVPTTAINYYIWLADTEIRVEAYLTTCFKGKDVNLFNNVSRIGFDDVPFGIVNKTYKLDQDLGTWERGLVWKHTDGVSTQFNQLDNDEYIPSRLVNLTQDGMRKTLINVLGIACSEALIGLCIDIDPIDYEWTWNYHTHYGDIYESVEGLGSTSSQSYAGDVVPISNWSGSNLDYTCRAILSQFLFNWATYGLILESDGAYNSYISNGYADSALTWTALLNKVVPALAYAGLFHSFWCAVASVEGIYAPMYTNMQTAKGFNMSMSSWKAGAFIPSNFRQDYEIIPPSQEPGTALKVILITAAVTTAIIATTVIAKAVIKKCLRKTMTRRYNKIAAMQQDYQSDPTEEKLKAFGKEVRQYNFLARLTGYSSLSYLNGWEAGDGSSSSALANTNVNDLENMMTQALQQAEVIQQDVAAVTGAQTADIIESFKGEGSDITLQDIEVLIAGSSTQTSEG